MKVGSFFQAAFNIPGNTAPCSILGLSGGGQIKSTFGLLYDFEPATSIGSFVGWLSATHKNIELEFENQVAYGILALVSPCFADPIRIIVFGDSLSWGFIPNEGRPSERYPVDSRWPGGLQKELGGDYEVIDEALNGRTTDASDNQLAGAGLDGSAYLPAAITSHHPLDLVIIMLGHGQPHDG